MQCIYSFFLFNNTLFRFNKPKLLPSGLPVLTHFFSTHTHTDTIARMTLFSTRLHLQHVPSTLSKRRWISLTQNHGHSVPHVCFQRSSLFSRHNNSGNSTNWFNQDKVSHSIGPSFAPGGRCVGVLVRDMSRCMMISGCFVSVSGCFPFTIRAGLLTCAQKRHPWKRHTMLSAPPNHAAVAQGAVKNAEQLQPAPPPP